MASLTNVFQKVVADLKEIPTFHWEHVGGAE